MTPGGVIDTPRHPFTSNSTPEGGSTTLLNLRSPRIRHQDEEQSTFTLVHLEFDVRRRDVPSTSVCFDFVISGEERTAELNSKYEGLNLEDLNNFKSDAPVQEWEGEDFRPGVCHPSLHLPCY